MTVETKPEQKAKKLRTDRKTSVQKIQSIVGTIEKRIAADAAAETKLTTKELTSLGNTVAKLSKILWEIDKEKIKREKTQAKGKTELFKN